MPIDINGIVISQTGNLSITNSVSHTLYQQSATGYIRRPTGAAGATLLPLFNVGWYDAAGWVSMTGVVPFGYTGGGGYINVGGCYNTSNYRFTAPWTGLYLLKQHIYMYNSDAGTAGHYGDCWFYVNGSSTTRRVGGPNYRRRHWGIWGSYGADSDMCDILYLTAGDYVEAAVTTGDTMWGYSLYSAWSGCYLGN